MGAVRVSGLEFQYPGSQGFTLEVPKLDIVSGSCAAIVGPSGSGKTTLLALLAGILSPRTGSIRVGDVDVSRLGETARRRFRMQQVGQVFQAFELLEYLTITQNVLLPRYIESSPDGPSRRRASELLESVGLAEKAGARPAELSHGERQRVAVCRAMLNQPTLLLADEPTGNLDQGNKQIVVDLLIRQARDQGSTLLMVTHDRGMLGSFEQVIDFDQLQGPLA